MAAASSVDTENKSHVSHVLLPSQLSSERRLGVSLMSTSLKELAQNALDANKALHYLLTRHAERLNAELQEVDRLLSLAADEDVADEAEPDIQIPGAKKAIAPFPAYELLKPESPFFEDAKRRTHYINNVTFRPMKARELEVLADAIQSEKMRLLAVRDKERSQASDSNRCMDVEDDELDWETIAEKVSDVSAYTRTAEECRIRWVGELTPQVNKDNWSSEEVTKLKDIISECQETSNEDKLDWEQIARKLGTNRTPIECLKQGIQRSRHTWSTESDQKLLEAIEKYGVDNWAIVARSVSEHVTAAQCQSRYSKTLDPSIKRGTWSETEDNRLRKAVAVHGNAWTEVARYITGRTNDQCRERWSEQLNVSSKGEWSQEDDDALREAHKMLGNQWKAISQRLGIGKTDSQCRIRLARLKKQDENATSKASKASKKAKTPKAPRKKIKSRQQHETENGDQPTQTNMSLASPELVSTRPSSCRTPETSACIEPSNQACNRSINQSIDSATDPAQVGEKRPGSPLADVSAPKKPRTSEPVICSNPKRTDEPVVVSQNQSASSLNGKQSKRTTKQADIPERNRRSARVAARSTEGKVR